MPVSSLLERMRKKLQEKAAATSNSTNNASTDNTASSPTEEGGSGNTAASTTAAPTAAPASSSTSSRAESAVPLPPPVFASPSSARLDYRDAVRDPLCAPFTADMAAPIAEFLLLTKLDNGSKAQSSNAHVLNSTNAEKASSSTANVVVENVEQYFTDILAEQAKRRDGHTEEQRTTATAAVPRCATIFEDASYGVACAQSRMDVSGTPRPMCRDVNYYSRVGRISQGVYGVVFRAVAADDSASEVHLQQQQQQQQHPAPQRKSYALKHIKKMWLEDSQIGFPPYLLREIDLLLRLKHPNVMGARELVLLDPTPLPRSVMPQAVAADGGETQPGPRRRPRENEDGDAGGFCDTPPPPLSQQQQRQKTETHVVGSSAATSAAAASLVSSIPIHPNGVSGDPAAAKPLSAVGAVSETKDVFLVMDFCPFDLTTYMRRYHTTTTQQIPFFHITPRNAHPEAAANYLARAKSIAYQLFRAVAFLHANRVLHRDLKTSNVLLDDDGYVKICDFGLGRLYREGQGLTPTVVTLMYRAPELHLGVADYSHKMDVWSLGCIVAELFLRRPLFYASTDMHHLLAVCDVIGIPTEETFPALYHLPQTKVMMQALPRWNRVSRLADLFQPGATMFTSTHGDVPVAVEATLLPAEGLDLLRSIFQWNPRRRPSAAEVLQHPFFHTSPLPCAPAELMRPMPWRDAAPVPPIVPDATRVPPPAEVTVPQEKAVAGGGDPSTSHSFTAKDVATVADVVPSSTTHSMTSALSATAEGTGPAVEAVSGSCAAPGGLAGEVLVEPKVSSVEDSAVSPCDVGQGAPFPNVSARAVDSEGEAERMEADVKLSQMKANQDNDDEPDGAG